MHWESLGVFMALGSKSVTHFFTYVLLHQLESAWSAPFCVSTCWLGVTR